MFWVGVFGVVIVGGLSFIFGNFGEWWVIVGDGVIFIGCGYQCRKVCFFDVWYLIFSIFNVL